VEDYINAYTINHQQITTQLASNRERRTAVMEQRKASVFVLLLVSVCYAAANTVLIQEVSALPSADRARIIKAAIASVKDQVKISSTTLPNGKIRTQNRLLDPAIDARGLSRVRLEKAVRKAEADLIKLRYKEALQSSDMSVKVEALAKVAFHPLGSLLSKSEITMIQQETSMCVEPTVPNCSGFRRRRTINGTCNNLRQPLLGSAGQNFRRILLPRYEDGISQPRGFMQSKGKDILGRDEFSAPNPSPREISRTVIRSEPLDDPRHTHIIMQWGQFLDHDLDLAPEFGEHDCPPESCIATEKCFPIRKVSDDPNFTDLPCLFFGRSIPSCDGTGGEFPAREQFNALTHYIDGSNVYGSTDEVAKVLREFSGGRLKVGPPHASGAKPSLPLLTRKELEATDVFLAICPEPLEECFVAGDIRVNEQQGLIVMHTIWLREHNRIVGKLQQLHTSLSDEELYQIGRQVVSGMMQAIVYQEYLPEVLGKSVVQNIILRPVLANGYNSSVNPSIPNSYATAAFRYGHSLIRPEFGRLDERYNSLSVGPLNLLDSFFKLEQYNSSLGTDPILRGLLTEPARRSDEFLNPVLTTQLFATDHFDGRDLAALNINRGRDHGLPPYLVWRDFCVNFFAKEGITVVPEFRSPLTRLELIRVYGSLDTVDLFAGGMAEEPFVHPNGDKSILGPTFTCIFAITFRAQASGDRFFFLNADTNTFAQRLQFKRASLSKVICDNADNVGKIQPAAFVQRSINNPLVDCSTIPSVDLTPFLPPVVGKCSGQKYVKISVRGSSIIKGSFMNDRKTYDTTSDEGFSASLSDSSTCQLFSCPASFTKIITFPFAPLRCELPAQASGLPPSTTTKEKTYQAAIDTNLMTTQNGFYNTLSECQKGPVSAITYTCGTRTSTTSTSTSTQAVLSDITEIVKVINETVTSQQVHKSNYQPGVKAEEKTVTATAKTQESNKNDKLLQELDDALNSLT
jgi:peroxidase